MATIDKKLIHFNRKADFEARLAAGDIRDYSIVCIKDAKLIWTHGQYYGDLSECLKVTEQTLTDAEKAQVMENLGIEIPTESTVSGWGFTKNTGTYSKPSTGIPKSDLASAVQTSLGKADTALQSYTEQYKGTVTGVKVNGSTKSPSSGTVDIGNVVTSVKINGSAKSPLSGVVDLGTVITSHQDISGKQDKLVSGTNIKTINGASILGSGNIVISGGSSSGGSGAYAEVNHGTSDTTFALTPNTFHVWDEVASLDLSFAEETAGVANEYLFQFTSGATATTLTLPDVKWASDTAPTIEANRVYQISVLKGLGSVLEFENTIEIYPITFYVNDNEFNAESWMTWDDFASSEYNVNVAGTSDKYVKIEGLLVYFAYIYEGENEIDRYVYIYTEGGLAEKPDNFIVDKCNYKAD